MKALELTKLIVQTLDDKKAKDIHAIEISDLTIIADYFIIATGTSTTHVRALADEVEFRLKNQHGILPLRSEGYATSQWILVDYGHVILHVFLSDTRDFYSLERLWGDGKNIPLEELIEVTE